MHRRQHPIGSVWRERDAVALRQHVQCCPLGAREVHIAIGDRANEGDLEHLSEALGAQRCVAEKSLEHRIERTQIQQRLVDGI